MPAPGNHENELGNGPIGYEAFQTYLATPRQPGQTDVTRGSAPFVRGRVPPRE